MRWFHQVEVDFDDLRAAVGLAVVGEPGPFPGLVMWSIEAEDWLGPIDYFSAHVWTAERYMFPIAREHVAEGVRTVLGRDDVDLVECLVPSTDTYDPERPMAVVVLAPSTVGSTAEVVELVRAGRGAGPWFSQWIGERVDLLTLVLGEGTVDEVVALIDLHDAVFHQLQPDMTAFALRNRPEVWSSARAAMDRAAVVSLERAAALEARPGGELAASVDRRRAAGWVEAARSLTTGEWPGLFAEPGA